MVGLVLVAHSPGLVEGLRAMVLQVAPTLPVATAGGTDSGRLGTSAPAVLAALRATLGAAGEGVIVLIDQGSAFLAVDLALDELAPDERSRVRLSRGPLVEGAVQAAVEARSGSSLDVVLRAADDACLVPKVLEP